MKKLLLAILLMAVVANAVDFSTCAYTISSPGTYRLTANLACTGNGITISADDVILNLNGKIVDGDDGTADRGIVISTGADRVLIENGSITDFGIGISNTNNNTYLTIRNVSASSMAGTAPNGRGFRLVGNTNSGYLQHVLIQNVSVFSNALDGIYVGLSSSGSPTISNITVDTSRVYSNSNYGVRYNSGSQMFIQHSTIYSNGQGFYIDSGNHYLFLNNTLYAQGTCIGVGVSSAMTNISTINNTLTNCSSFGIYYYYSGLDNSTISGNTLTNASNLRVEDAQRINVTGNQIRNQYLGIRLESADYSIVANNNITNSTVWAILLADTASNNLVTENIITNSTSGDACIRGTGATSNNITNNNITTCSNDGIQLLTGSNGNRVTGNNIVNSSVSGSTSGIGSDSDGLVVQDNVINGGYDGITFNGDSSNASGNVFANLTHYGLSITGDGNTFTNDVVYNAATAGIRIASAATNNNFTNVFVYNESTFITHTSTGTNNFFNSTFGYNSTIGHANWTSFSIGSSATMTEGTNVYLQPAFVSVNSSALSMLNSEARVRIQTDAGCQNTSVLTKSGLPASLDAIRTNGTLAGLVASCASGIANFTASGFSGYAIGANFTVFLYTPANLATLSGVSANLAYNMSTISPTVTCTVNMDAGDIDTQDLTANGTVNVSAAAASGSHLWYVTCNDTLNTITTPTWQFSMNYQTYENTINLSNSSENVYSTPQALFYDTQGNLTLLYFIDRSPTDEVKVHKIAGGAIAQTWNQSFNVTKAFYAAFREGSNTTLLTFNQDNATMHFLLLNSTTLSIADAATSYNVVPNSYYDPLAYANTKHFDSLNQSADSYFLFVLPTTADTKLIRKNVSSATLQELATLNHNRKVVWQTILDDQNMTRWLYANLSNSSCSPTTDQIQLWSYNGTAFALNATPDTNCYSQANIEGSRVFFERYGNYTYMLLANLTGNTTIFQVEGNKTVKLNYTVSNPSKLLFIDQDTFVFFDANGSTNLAYSCYFGGSSPACTRFSAFDYGASVPYTQGAMTTAKRDGTADVVATGTVANVGNLQFHYSETEYDTKFIEYDEKNEYRQTFKVQVYTNTTGNVLQNYSWGYVIPSSLLGDGTKRAYALGENGTIRLYVVGLTSFAIDFYSLNVTQGQYYTFTIKDAFGQPVQGAILTAYRFNNAKQAWVVIEQGITDYTGSATFFLEPFTLYQMTVQKDGYVTLSYDFIPSTTTSVTVNLASGGNETLEVPGYDYMWNDTSFSLAPTTYYSRNNTNITFTVASSGGKLEYYGMKVTRKFNGTTTVVYSNNITTQPSGGAVQYEVNQSGIYYIDTWFKHEDYDEYDLLTKTFQNGNTSFMKARDEFLATNPIGAWGFYFLAVVVAMLVGGFISRYTFEGAGLVSLAVLWIFTLFNPAAELVCIAGIDSCMTSMHATILTTVAVLGGLYYVWRGG